MSYSYRITRSQNWVDATDKITFEEWRRIATDDPQLVPYDDSPDEDGFRMRDADFDNYLYYDADCGTINIKPGLHQCVRKAVEIAANLGAVVQGENGEYYLLTDSFYETVWERPSAVELP